MQLSQTQIDQMKQQGLQDADIAALAQKHGHTLPVAKPSIAKELGTNLRSRATNIVGAVKRAATGKETLQAAKFDAAGQAFGAIGDIGAAATDAVTRATGLDKPLDALGQKLASIPGAQSLGQKAADFYNGLDEAERAHIDAAFGFAEGAATIAGGGAVAGTAKKVVKSTATAAAKAVGKDTVALAAKDDKFAIDFALPKATPATQEAALARGSKGVTEPGIFKKSQLAPGKRDLDIAASIRGIVSPKKTVLQNIDAIKTRVGEINTNVGDFVYGNKAPFNAKQLRTKLVEPKADSSIIFASDPTLERTYDAVVEAFIKEVAKKDTFGLFKARQSFDQIPAIKKLLEGAKGPGAENLKRQVVLDVRRAANEYIADLLPAGNKYAAQLRQESAMLEAIGRAAEKEVGTVGRNKMQALLKQNPYIGTLAKWIIPSALTGAGVGYITH